MSAITTTRPKPQVNILDKRIPRNPKYENVESTLDTGESLTKFLKRHEELRASSKQQATETFKRMKISTLVQLIIQVEEINSLDIPNSTASQRTLTNTDRPQTQDSQMSTETTRSTLQSVIRGVGEMDVYNNTNQNRFSTTPKTSRSEQIDLEFNERPYLLVDLRDKDEFKTNHIISAHHYPAAMLSRCSNNESKELLIYKNQKGKIIILYDEDERIASPAATIMVERGYNNIFLLSGGIKYSVRKFPRGLLTGSCPLSWTLSSTPHTPSTKVKRLHPITPNHHETPVGQSLASATRRPPGPMITFGTHEQFTNHDIEELNIQLDKNLLTRDSSTRLSRSTASKQSSRSSLISQRSNISNISDKPWKP